jgi:C-terminal processing protease CtpA/Prc
VRHHELATVVGAPTAGTNGNVNPFTLASGHTLGWTGMRVTDQDGGRHHGVGVQPHIRVAPTITGVRAGKDEVLERGLEVIRGARKQ